jgi:hypothetical protein
MPRFKNPFHHGGRVSGEDFWDRQVEVEELLEDFRSHQRVIIFSQRQLGKTSLVWRVLEEAEKEGPVVGTINGTRCPFRQVQGYDGWFH